MWTQRLVDEERNIWAEPQGKILQGCGGWGWGPRSAGVTPWAVRLRGPAAATATETVLSLLQPPGTRPRRSTGQPRSRPCPSASRLPYVPAFLLSLIVVRVGLERREGSPSALGYRCLPVAGPVVLPHARHLPPTPEGRRRCPSGVVLLLGLG